MTERVLKAFRREPGSEGLPEAALDAAAEVRGYFGAEVAGRRKNPREDVLTSVSKSKNVEGKR
jgi:cytochrome P450